MSDFASLRGGAGWKCKAELAREPRSKWMGSNAAEQQQNSDTQEIASMRLMLIC